MHCSTKERHRPTEVSALCERGVSVRCDREDVCMQTAGGYNYANEGQEMHRQRKWVRCFKRAVTVLSALCQCPLMATETLRGERMCANSGRIYGDSVRGMHRQRKEGDSNK